MSEFKGTPGPWAAENRPGAGWEVRGILPTGFQFDATYCKADGSAAFQIWVLTSPQSILISCERWVQFETKSWEEMQEANARLIAASPDLLEACKAIIDHPLVHATDPAAILARNAIAKAISEGR